ncbi:(2,3-dihydroxybenzoyl)adenylate synthase [Nocardia sp. NBC_00511]|uniref:(2,3-dihydroxybenzoyl)adenylate synthase n=1 Tax=Nocardia sp. NBC_00511 TaxID=2903591 RepID=UPI003863DD18
MDPAAPDHRDGFVPFPADLAQRYRQAGYWTGRPLGELLRAAARATPTAPALHPDPAAARPAWLGSGESASGASGPAITYAELDAAADRMAHGLLSLGIRTGDRVVVQLRNTPVFVPVLFGLLRAGIIPVLTLPAHRRAEIEHLARLSGAVAYLVSERDGEFDYRALADEVAAAVPTLRHVLVHGDPGHHTALDSVPAEGDSLPEIDASDIALMLVSGGTTGLPKLIARTHDDYTYNATASAEVCELGPQDVYLATLPVAHNFPLACPGILGTVATGGSMVFVTDPSPESVFATIERYGVTVTAVVPPLAQLWCAAVEWEEADLSSLRLLQVGGAKLAEVNAREVGPALNVRVQQVFGMAEGLLNYTRAEDSDDLVCTTQGRPLSPADEVRVVDEHGRDVAPGEEGELLTRGPYTLRGYYRAPEHNSRAFTPDGFYRSGDLVRQLPSGHLIVSGRIKDVINRGGENISCDELEEHLLAHPVVRHAAAVGLPDPALGEKVCVVLVTDGEAPTLAELKSFLTARGLATYKLPDVLRRTDILPVTAVGKIDKKALAAAR